MYMADPLPDDVLLDMGLDEIVTLRHNPGALPDLIRSVEDLFNLVDPEEFPAPHGKAHGIRTAVVRQ